MACFREGHKLYWPKELVYDEFKLGKGDEMQNEQEIGGSRIRMKLDMYDEPVGDNPREVDFHTKPIDGRRLVFRVTVDQDRVSTAWLLVKSINDGDSAEAVPSATSTSEYQKTWPSSDMSW